jgi:hypothetical protein
VPDAGGGAAAPDGLAVQLSSFSNWLHGHGANSAIHMRANARVGELGNPADGYGGKTASVIIDGHQLLTSRRRRG